MYDNIEQVVENNGKKRERREEWESENHREYPEDIIEEFRNGMRYLKLAQTYVQRIDYLLSGDDGEDSFRERLKNELEKLDK